MRSSRAAVALSALLGLAACIATAPPAPNPPIDDRTKGFPNGISGLPSGIGPPPSGIGRLTEVRDSVYLPVDRKTPPPAGYGLYTVLLARTADRNTLRVLSELFVTAGSAGEAAMARGNLNLITLPVKNVADAQRTLARARSQPEATATAMMQGAYDYGQAALLMASVCYPFRGAAVMKACGSLSPDGPLLVSTLRPLDGALAPGQPLLVVNLSTTPPEALREVLAAYRRQIQRADFADRAEIDTWRLLALNHVLDAAKLLPGISKAYAAGR